GPAGRPMPPDAIRRDALGMTTSTSAAAQALRGTKVLVGAYLALCVLTLVFAGINSGNASMVNDAVWTRGVIVTISAVLSFSFVTRAARGSRKGFLRLRIVSAVMTVAIAILISLPGLFPVWMRIEQGVCGVLLLAVVAIVNSRRVRSLFVAERG